MTAEKQMTIAEQAKASSDYYAFAEENHVDVDQDWDNETTTYIFEDGSKLECCGPELTAK